MIRRLLVDYGEVLSAPLAEDAVADLAALAGQPRATFIDRYWRLRPAYDLGQPPTEYWSAVLDRDLGMRTITFTSASDLDRELRLTGTQQGCSQ